jgi:AcrR family transcriptional regulator
MTAVSTVPLADARAELVRRRALEGAVVVLERGEVLTFAAVASAAGVPERTLYRHFQTREALHVALYDWVNERLAVDEERPTTAEALARLVRRAFPGFDAMAPVIRELLAAPEGRLARLAANPERQRAALGVVAHDAGGLPSKQARQVAAVLQLLTAASTWQALRDYWNMDGAEAAETAVLASELLLEGARARQARLASAAHKPGGTKKRAARRPRKE